MLLGRDRFTVTFPGMRNLPVASQCTNNHSNGIIIVMNCTGSFCLLQNTFGPCHIDCGLRLSENIPYVCVCLHLSHTVRELSHLLLTRSSLFPPQTVESWSQDSRSLDCLIVSELRLTHFCQRVEYEVSDYIYETRSGLVEICREEPASSIVIFDRAVPFCRTTRRHIPEDSSPHRCCNFWGQKRDQERI